mgnify:CR=1 FL=1
MKWPWQEEGKQGSKALAFPHTMPQNEMVMVDEVPTDLAPAVPRTTADRLTEEQRTFILQCLGQFRTYADIQRGLQEHFDVSVEHVAISYYVHAPKWRKIIAEERTSYLAKTNSVPISHQVVRMERYEKGFQECVARGERREALIYLRAAAEEMGKIGKAGDNFAYYDQRVANFNREQCEQALEDGKTQEVLDGTPTRVSEAGATVPASQ